MAALRDKLRTEILNAGVEMKEALKHFERADDLNYRLFYLDDILNVVGRVKRSVEACAQEVRELK